MDIQEKQSAIEAILFASGGPVTLERIAAALELDQETAEELLGHLADSYDFERRGFKILKLENSYQLASRADYAAEVKRAMDNRRDYTLSNASLEVLAIVAYNQPTTRLFVEQVRGVDSSSVILNLCDRGLLEETGYLDVPGHPKLYGTTPDFLRCFCISSISELPGFESGEQMKLEMGEPESAEGAPEE